MIELEIKPHEGIGPIKLGASRAAVRAALAGIGFTLLSARGRHDRFCDNSIQVEFDAADNAQFIGVGCHPKHRVMYRGTNVFDVTAKELFALIASNDHSGLHEFNINEYEFPNQIVTLWDADEQYDYLGGEKRPVWCSVGLGNEIYQQAVRQIKSK